MEGAEGTTLQREILQRNMSVFLITEWFLNNFPFWEKTINLFKIKFSFWELKPWMLI